MERNLNIDPNQEAGAVSSLAPDASRGSPKAWTTPVVTPLSIERNTMAGASSPSSDALNGLSS
jgi:hypothetical protein